jgi:ATP-dependent protease HslVU (ClpYQ) peptidase subunit
MYENEFEELTLQLRQMRERIFTLVEMNDQLAAEKTKAAADLQKAADNVARLQDERSELLRKVNSMLLVSDQRDHLHRENQRLLMEKRDRESR